MKLFLDGKPTATFSKRQMRELMAKARPDAAIDAVVIDVETANARVARAGRWFYGALGLLMAILIGAILIGLAFDGSTSDDEIVLPVAIAVALFCYFLLRWGYRRGLRKWAQARDLRAAAMAAPGTRLHADGDRLTIGDRSAAWPALQVAELHFNEMSSSEDTAYVVERLALVDGDGRIWIDRDLIDSGTAVVNFAFAKLFVERGFKELRSDAADG